MGVTSMSITANLATMLEAIVNQESPVETELPALEILVVLPLIPSSLETSHSKQLQKPSERSLRDMAISLVFPSLQTASQVKSKGSATSASRLSMRPRLLLMLLLVLRLLAEQFVWTSLLPVLPREAMIEAVEVVEVAEAVASEDVEAVIVVEVVSEDEGVVIEVVAAALVEEEASREDEAAVVEAQTVEALGIFLAKKSPFEAMSEFRPSTVG